MGVGEVAHIVEEGRCQEGINPLITEVEGRLRGVYLIT